MLFFHAVVNTVCDFQVECFAAILEALKTSSQCIFLYFFKKSQHKDCFFYPDCHVKHKKKSKKKKKKMNPETFAA